MNQKGIGGRRGIRWPWGLSFSALCMCPALFAVQGTGSEASEGSVLIVGVICLSVSVVAIVAIVFGKDVKGKVKNGQQEAEFGASQSPQQGLSAPPMPVSAGQEKPGGNGKRPQRRKR